MAVAESDQAGRQSPASAPFGDMAWNPHPLRTMRAALARCAEGASLAPSGLSWSARRQLLAILRRHAAVLQLTFDLAVTARRLEQHAVFGARLAILRARVEAGDTSRSLAAALIAFAREFDSFITSELGYRSV